MFNLLDVGQTQTEAFHVVYVAGMHAVEFVEHFLDVVLLDALAIVLDAEAQVLAFVPGADMYVDRLVGLTIFHSIVQQVRDGIGEMNLVDEDGRVDGFYLGSNLSTCMPNA